MAGNRVRQIAIGAGAVVVLVVGLALALGGGGGGGHAEFAGLSKSTSGAALPATASGLLHGSATSSLSREPAGLPGSSTSAASDASAVVAAPRVVKTGSMSVSVPRGQVQASVGKLAALASRLGGYVSASHTESVDGSPSGAVTLRIPAASFDDAVVAAAQLGHQTSLNTTAHDVTGRYVDLAAREAALTRTRSTYLTILGQAKTIGSTLAVQQRIDDVQQQIEELHGQLKVLGNQSAYGTLTVDVSQAGAAVVHPTRAGTGIGAAWHRSVHRFNRGIDGIVGVLGPLFLALLILGALAIIALVGFRVVRRLTVPPGPTTEP